VKREVLERNNRWDVDAAADWYRRAFDDAPIGMLIAGVDGRILRVNHTLCGILGYDVEALLATDILSLTHPDDRGRSLEAREQFISGEIDQIDLINRFVRCDGATRWASVHSSLVRTPSGEPDYFLSQVQDITPRIEAELTLQQRSAILEAVTHAAHRFMASSEWQREIGLVLARLGLAAGASRVFLREVLEEEEELVAVRRAEWTGPTTPAARMEERERIRLVASGFGWVAEALRRREAVQLRRSEASGVERRGLETRPRSSAIAVPIFSEGELWGYLSIHDCENDREWSEPVIDALQAAADLVGGAIERQRAHTALQESEERYRKLVELSPEPIVVHAAGRILFANSAAIDLLQGDGQTELIGGSITDLVDPRVRGEIEERLLAAYERNETVRHFGEPFLLQDGRLHYLEISSAPVAWMGKPARQAVVRDVTEQREREEELRHSREVMRDLARRAVTVREEEQKRISRRIHDELGQNLTALKLDLAYLRGPARERVQALERMNEILEETIGRVREIASELRPPVLDDLGLAGAIEWAVAEFQTRSGISCSLAIDEGWRELDQARSTVLFRIVQEALSNVARHAAASRVDVMLSQASGEATLAVRDNGKGISADELAGRRLGILGMRENAASLGGELEIDSRPGQGTVVRVILPRDDRS
jgi:PAS domain S-box-containing protein